MSQATKQDTKAVDKHAPTSRVEMGMHAWYRNLEGVYDPGSEQALRRDIIAIVNAIDDMDKRSGVVRIQTSNPLILEKMSAETGVDINTLRKILRMGAILTDQEGDTLLPSRSKQRSLKSAVSNIHKRMLSRNISRD